MYQLNGEELIMGWLAEEPDAEARWAVLDWLTEPSADPIGVATATLPRPGIPAYIAQVPETHTFLNYAVVEQYRTVVITGIRTTPKAER